MALDATDGENAVETETLGDLQQRFVEPHKFKVINPVK